MTKNDYVCLTAHRRPQSKKLPFIQHLLAVGTIQTNLFFVCYLILILAQHCKIGIISIFTLQIWKPKHIKFKLPSLLRSGAKI